MPAQTPPTAFFDYDGTLIEGDSILYWQRYYYARRPLMRVFQIANCVGLVLLASRIINSHMLKRVFLWPLVFEKPEALDALARGFVRGDLSFRFHGPVLARLWAHHRLGHGSVVISASGTFYLKYLAEFFPPDTVLLGTQMDLNNLAGGILRFPRYRDGNLRGANKIRRLRALGYAAAGSGGFAYSDHHHDIPLLEFVSHPNCIRPTAKLEKYAEERSWPIWEGGHWPRSRAKWKLKLEALCLLLFAAAPKFLAATPEPSLPADAAIEEQVRQLSAGIPG